MPLALPAPSACRALHRSLPTLQSRCWVSLHRQGYCKASINGGFCSGVPTLLEDRLNVIIECSFQHGRSVRSPPTLYPTLQDVSCRCCISVDFLDQSPSVHWSHSGACLRWPTATAAAIHNAALTKLTIPTVCLMIQERDIELKSLARQLVNVHALCKNHPIPCNVIATGVNDTLRAACQRYSPGKWNISFFRDSLQQFLPIEGHKQACPQLPMPSFLYSSPMLTMHEDSPTHASLHH